MDIDFLHHNILCYFIYNMTCEHFKICYIIIIINEYTNDYF
jgi:hypothetical protein